MTAVVDGDWDKDTVLRYVKRKRIAEQKKWSNPRKNLMEELALKTLSHHIQQTLNRRGASSVLRELMILNGALQDELDDAHIVPDGWCCFSISDPNDDSYKVAMFTVIEVENTCPINEQKLRKYAHKWWGIDSTSPGLQLNVITTNRWGNEFHLLNLQEVYYMAL